MIMKKHKSINLRLLLARFAAAVRAKRLAHPGWQVAVVPLRVNVNLQGLTLEGLVARRKARPAPASDHAARLYNRRGPLATPPPGARRAPTAAVPISKTDSTAPAPAANLSRPLGAE